MSEQIWKPRDYDRQLSFVSAYGKGLAELLAPRAGERILDLGCGTGDLAYEISTAGAYVTGMDSAVEMIEQAQTKYKSLAFRVGNGENFTVEAPYDAVFSNAALHWMKNAAGAVRSVHGALRSGGRFVAEFGGQGNIETIYEALRTVFADHYGIDADTRNPWYFPSVAEYATLLEAQGFRVRMAHHYDRPTKLSEGKEGVRYWLLHFGDHFFTGFTAEERDHAIARISQISYDTLWHEDAYYADYKRLRIIAEKL
ncbi:MULTISPECIES: trans-aconitate 2-methyltransferase [Paenibacillus]|uniref:class I SAM-dependent methyltransferase n=1 Tax=Paenibacillus TaxID=44249 RepID=UPI001164FEEA|nr:MULTISPECIES: class I SAM-dependent methyltransferase [Paenibacillus]AWP29136.1 SAM-dependent methyltransferase [Paenibacillus sp. Cedars]MDH6674764.1 trans-aconitate methyltransferase [Paenibacillus sp. LBL]MPY20436.1 class I SAM-dependent methyltransferase [Paenibacillus glucanolyticus]